MAGVPRPFSCIASRSSSSSTSLPAPSIALSSVASVNRAGGLVWVAITSTLVVLTVSFGCTGASLGVSSVWASLAINRQPARVHQHFAHALERLALDARDARGLQKLRRRVEHRQEALGDHVVELGLRFVQVLGRLGGGDDGKVVRDFGVVENPLVGSDPAALENLAREGAVLRLAQHAERLVDRVEVIFRQGARIGARIGQDLVPFIKGLGQSEGRLGGEAEASVGLALQAGQVVEQGRELGGRLALFGDDARFAQALVADGLSLLGIPQALGLEVGLAVFPGEFLVEPAARRIRPPGPQTCRGPPSNRARRSF